MLKKYLPILYFLVCCTAFCQDGFVLPEGKSKLTIPFISSNNLVITTVMVNGTPLNFILDTGVQNTILFSFEDVNTETIDLKNVEKIKIRGLGSGAAIDAYRSTNNKVALKEYIDFNHEMYIILDQDINFSAQLGIPIHGILGYYFFKNHLVEINHIAHKINIYKDIKAFSTKKIKRYNALPISIELEKPYVKAKVSLNNLESEVKLLVDTGGSDALWLFENDKHLQCPKDFYEDFLGKGFSGDIHGKRSRIDNFSLAGIDLSQPTVSFPEASSLKSVELVEGRNGSIGSGVIKRFNVIFDYPNHMMYIKKNKDFDTPFQYNMSGMEVQHNGKELVKEEFVVANNVTRDSRGAVNIDLSNSTPMYYNFILKPIFEVSSIRKNSPAEEAGILKGDIIKKINGLDAYKYKLSQINELLQSEDGRWISLVCERKGKLMKFKLQLRKML